MRRTLAFRLSAISALVLTTMAGRTQQPVPPKPAQVSFHLVRPGLDVPDFMLEINEDGTGRYQAEQVDAGGGRPASASPSTQHIDRAITLTPAITRATFAAAHALHYFTDPCASPAKNIADTGTKTLRYTGGGDDGTCTYNYSQDKRVAQLTDMFQGIAATLDLGRKLAFDHRFDRLGLDADTARLVQEADAGRAIELGTIASTLRSIVEDADILERVRSRANKLLLQTQIQGQLSVQYQRQPAS